MAICLSEADIGGLITIADAIDTAEEVFKINGQDGVINLPSQQINTPGGYLRLTSAIVIPMKKIAVKVSSSMVFDSDSGRPLLLIDSKTGRVDAIIEVFRLGALRTAVASGVATKYLAKENATSLGVIGAGRQARTQIFAIRAVRPIDSLIVLGRDQPKTFQFWEEMSSQLGFLVNVAKDHLDLYDCSIICTATTSHKPVLFGKNLSLRTHINSIGANRMERQELDDEVIPKCSIVTVNNKDQAQKESALLNRAIKDVKSSFCWDGVLELSDCIKAKGQIHRQSDAITPYNSHGIVMEDVALATKAFDLATEKGIGSFVEFTGV
ncbi:MAG: ornithine cyclodeaminase family protein [Pseudomonadota bacterium]|nr:ornithine cyclodeaminase family protein [Pseudomonadota bacterium]